MGNAGFKLYVKMGARVLFDYIVALILFVIFLYPLIGLAGENLYRWLPFYSLLMFLFAFYLIYIEMKVQAAKEKKPQNMMNPYPLKGAVYGLAGVIPLAFVAAVVSAVPVADKTIGLIRHKAVNALLGPLYFFFRLFNESLPGYVAAIMLIPAASALGYLAGYFGINIMGKIFKKKEAAATPGFVKSPWNPTLHKKKSAGEGKKSKKKSK